jgi:hypothetical protein
MYVDSSRYVVVGRSRYDAVGSCRYGVYSRYGVCR